MTEDNIKIMRLSSGEEIISKIVEQEHVRSISVRDPLKIMTYPKVVSTGIEESLSLQRWIHFTEEKTFDIPKSQILAIGTATFGLQKFYNHCVEKINQERDLGAEPTDKQLSEIEEEGDWLEDDLEELPTPSKVYH